MFVNSSSTPIPLSNIQYYYLILYYVSILPQYIYSSHLNRSCFKAVSHPLFRSTLSLSLSLSFLYISFIRILKPADAKIFNSLCSPSLHLTARQSRQTLRLQVDTCQQTFSDSPIEASHLRLLPQTLRMSLILQNALTTAGPLTLPTSAPYPRKLLPFHFAKRRGFNQIVT